MDAEKPIEEADVDTEDDEDRRTRGVVPIEVEREVLFTIPLKFRTADLPRWRPKTTGDYGRASHDEDDDS